MIRRSQAKLCGAGLLALLTTAACGRSPSFDSKSGGFFATDKGAQAPAAPATADSEATLPADYLAQHPNASGTGGAADATKAPPPANDPGAPSAANPSGDVTAMPAIPGAKPADIDALHRCLAAWPGNPFMGTTPVAHFKEIFAAVSVMSNGAAINDTENTPFPMLILIDAGVNVFGTPSYNLLNKNGYYCMRVNVNVLTDLAVNLHCNARLADPKVDVNVLSTKNDSTAGVGVNVLSDVKVTAVRPQGDTCTR